MAGIGSDKHMELVLKALVPNPILISWRFTWWSSVGWWWWSNSRYPMMTSSNGNIFRVTGHLCGKFTGPRWITRTKASDAKLWFFSLICARVNCWVNNREAGGLRRHRTHYDVIVMLFNILLSLWSDGLPVERNRHYLVGLPYCLKDLGYQGSFILLVAFVAGTRYYEKVPFLLMTIETDLVTIQLSRYSVD